MSGSALGAVDLSTQSSARNSLSAMSFVDARIGAELVVVGSYQRRLLHDRSFLSCVVASYSEASARIADLDVAEETAALVKAKILQQAASSVLAQANQNPRHVLAWLKNG